MKRMFAILLAFLVLVQSTWVLAADFSDGTGDDTFSSGSEDMITEPSEEEIFSEPDMSSEDGRLMRRKMKHNQRKTIRNRK